MKIGAIVLAAGSSKRFNGDKRRSMLDTGKSLLETSITNAAPHFTETIVVLRSGDSDYAAELSSNLNNSTLSFYCAPDSALGMAHSLGNVISTLDQWDAAVVFLGDMPYLKPETIDKLINAYNSNADLTPIIVPVKAGKNGHPVIFDKAYFDAIVALKGDVGAKAVINANSGKVIEVAVDDSGIIKDIDLPESGSIPR
jgi:molybdenum cofactor cytidylyltransferase